MSDTDRKLLNCYTDLNRAAVSLKIASKNTYRIFANHALRILQTIKAKRAREFERQIVSVLDTGLTDNEKAADKILTIGLLLKP